MLLATLAALLCPCLSSANEDGSNARGVLIGIRPGGFVEFKGVLQSEDEAEFLIEGVRAVRPDLRISIQHLKIDANALPIPVLDQIPSFIEELALTTHEWDLASKQGEFLISAQTDSLVTHAAFQARLNLLKFDDSSLRVRNLICLVSKDDLPVTPRFLPDALSEEQQFFTHMPIIAAPEGADGGSDAPTAKFSETGEIRSAGIRNLMLGIILDTEVDSGEAGLLVPDRLDWLFLEEDREFHHKGQLVAQVIQPSQSPLVRAEPTERADEVVTAEADQERPPMGRRFLMRAKPIDKPAMKVLGLIPFSDQNFMLQVSQMEIIENLSKELASEALQKEDVVLSARVGGSGTDAFNEWVSNKRVAEVKRMLIDLGVHETRLSIELKAAKKDESNPHRVDILVPNHQIAEEATNSIFRNDSEPEAQPVVLPTASIVPSSTFKTPEKLESAFVAPVLLDVE